MCCKCILSNQKLGGQGTYHYNEYCCNLVFLNQAWKQGEMQGQQMSAEFLISPIKFIVLVSVRMIYFSAI